MELAFAGLHQLCAPLLDRLERLPGPQRDALATAFSLRDGGAGSLPVGLAVLSLLSEVAGERPLVCVVDDAHWLDRASAQALAFVARHLAASRAVVFAVREPAPTGPDRTGGVVVRGLADGDARALLDSAVTARWTAGTRSDRGRDAGQSAGAARAGARADARGAGGRVGLPGAAGSSSRIEESFRRRLEPLPAATRLLLLVAAAEPVRTRCWCGGRQVGWGSGSRPRRRRPRPGSSNPAGRYGSVIRWPAPRCTGRPRRRNGGAPTVPWQR